MSDESGVIRPVLPVNDRDHVLGPESAAVTLVEYGNYECIYRRQLHPHIKEVLRRAEGVRFVFRHFPIRQVHPHSTRAASGRCTTFCSDGRGNSTTNSSPRCAAKAGLDLRRYSEEMAAGAYAEKIDRELMAATFVGKVTGTPTIYLNGVRRSDMRGLEGLLAAVEEAGATLRAGPGAWVKTLNRLRKLRLV